MERDETTKAGRLMFGTVPVTLVLHSAIDGG
jgi:hypothetical protein